MPSSYLPRAGFLARITLWGALAYSIAAPAYKLVEGIESLTQLSYAARDHIDARTDDYRAEHFNLLFRQFGEQAGKGEQEAIRHFRREIEKNLGINCNTVDDASYDPPKVGLGKRGVYELRMPCRTRELVISFPRAAVELRSPGE